MSEENISLPVAQALASALEKIEAYVPTEYVDNSEPDIDAEHLNHAEQGIMRVTKLLNAAVDVIQGQESRLADAETKIGTAALTGGMTDLSSGLNALNNLTNTIHNDQNGLLWFGNDVGFIQIKPGNGNIYRLQVEENGSVSMWYSTDGGANFTQKEISPSPFA